MDSEAVDTMEWANSLAPLAFKRAKTAGLGVGRDGRWPQNQNRKFGNVN